MPVRIVDTAARELLIERKLRRFIRLRVRIVRKMERSIKTCSQLLGRSKTRTVYQLGCATAATTPRRELVRPRCGAAIFGQRGFMRNLTLAAELEQMPDDDASLHADAATTPRRSDPHGYLVPLAPRTNDRRVCAA